jgi:2-furoyl-CoA dehydrogenase large subunit
MTVPAVIANAVTDALKPLGVRITELPMTPSRLWHIIREARSRQPSRTGQPRLTPDGPRSLP